MSRSILVHLLPASDGDCILVQAEADGALIASVLIDGGRAKTYRMWKPILDKLVSSRPILDLIVVTHLDADHIGGILGLLADDKRGLGINEIWFNGHSQVLRALHGDGEKEAFSVKQADELTRLIRTHAIPHNASAGGAPFHRGADSSQFVVGPFQISVLTPSREKLAAMSGPWQAALQAATGSEGPPHDGLEALGAPTKINVRALAQTPDVNDTARPNGSSIGLLVEVFGRTLLLSADSHPDDLASGLKRLLRQDRERLSVDLFKISHHGGRTSTTKEVLDLVVADIYAFSTDSSFRKHPDDAVVAKVLMSKSSSKSLAFNYRTPTTERWADPDLEEEFKYTALFPDVNEEGHLLLTFSEC